MKFYLDTEFNGFGGELISLGIVAENGDNLYLVDINHVGTQIEPWVAENVIPILWDLPKSANIYKTKGIDTWGHILSGFIYGRTINPEIIVDWPSDAIDFCKLLITGPGTAVPMSNMTRITILRHIDVYPTGLQGAVQHNALWDAMAIKYYCEEQEAFKGQLFNADGSISEEGAKYYR